MKGSNNMEENKNVDTTKTETEKTEKGEESKENLLEAKLKELEDRFATKEKELKEKELKLKAQEKLTEKGLDKDFVKYLNFDEENLESMIDDIANVVSKQIKTVTDSTYKPANYNVKKTNISKEDFKKMNYNEKVKLYNENKELYRKLSE